MNRFILDGRYKELLKYYGINMEEALRTFYSSHLESTEKGLQVTQ